MLGMKVPVPPAIDDYTKTVYSFEDGSLKNTVTSLIAGQGGMYKVSYLRQWVDDFAVVAAPPSIVNRTSGDTVANAATVITPISTAVTGAANGAVGIAGAQTELANVKTAVTTALNAILANTTYTSAQKIAASQAAAQARAAAAAAAAAATATTAAGTVKAAASGAITALNSAITAAGGINKFMIGANELRVLGSTPTPTEILADPYLSSLSDANGTVTAKITKLIEQEKMQMAQLDDAYGPSALGWAVRYVQNTTTGAYEPQFFDLDVLTSDNTIYDSTTGQSQSHIQAYKVGSQQKNEEIKGVNARLEQDATGRIINITLNPGEPDSVTYALTTSTVADQMRYNDAINQYEYDKYQYDQAIQEINAKIQIIQTQDKNLELRLKQLDTEQNAIQTEMDAVSKVIQKNVESTFKTFG
jgi:hypothetical protein